MTILGGFSNFFNGIANSLPENYQVLVGLSLYVLFIVLYAVFIWKFYKFISKRNIIELNFRKYNRATNPGLEKFYAVVLDTVEYIIILPFLVLFWFVVLALFLLVLSKSADTSQILLITAAIIASTRIAAYIHGDLSKDLAKIIPFTVLALFLLEPDFFNVNDFFDKIAQIPSLFENILIFIVFIFVVEFVLRAVYTIVEVIRSRNSPKVVE